MKELLPQAHYTPKGLLSMNPAKWQVCKFQLDVGFELVVGWAVYPPHSVAPLPTIHPRHGDAIEEAQTRAMFNVVPPTPNL